MDEQSLLFVPWEDSSLNMFLGLTAFGGGVQEIYFFACRLCG
jgi:hypothetical protein